MQKPKRQSVLFFCVWLALLSLLSCLTGCRVSPSSHVLEAKIDEKTPSEQAVEGADRLCEETYGDYLDRMALLLADRESKIEFLKTQIHLVGQELVVLEDTLSKTLAEQVDLRLGLAAGHAADLIEVDAFSLFDRYIVQEKDTLVDLALARYGTKSAWLALYQLNQEVCPNGPDDLRIGSCLLMPCFLVQEGQNL